MRTECLEDKQSRGQAVFLFPKQSYYKHGTAHLFRYMSNEEPTPFLSVALVSCAKAGVCRSTDPAGIGSTPSTHYECCC